MSYRKRVASDTWKDIELDNDVQEVESWAGEPVVPLRDLMATPVARWPFYTGLEDMLPTLHLAASSSLPPAAAPACSSPVSGPQPTASCDTSASTVEAETDTEAAGSPPAARPPHLTAMQPPMSPVVAPGAGAGLPAPHALRGPQFVIDDDCDFGRIWWEGHHSESEWYGGVMGVESLMAPPLAAPASRKRSWGSPLAPGALPVATPRPPHRRAPRQRPTSCLAPVFMSASEANASGKHAVGATCALCSHGFKNGNKWRNIRRIHLHWYALMESGLVASKATGKPLNLLTEWKAKEPYKRWARANDHRISSHFKVFTHSALANAFECNSTDVLVHKHCLHAFNFVVKVRYDALVEATGYAGGPHPDEFGSTYSKRDLDADLQFTPDNPMYIDTTCLVMPVDGEGTPKRQRHVEAA